MTSFVYPDAFTENIVYLSSASQPANTMIPPTIFSVSVRNCIDNFFFVCFLVWHTHPSIAITHSKTFFVWAIGKGVKLLSHSVHIYGNSPVCDTEDVSGVDMLWYGISETCIHEIFRKTVDLINVALPNEEMFKLDFTAETLNNLSVG